MNMKTKNRIKTILFLLLLLSILLFFPVPTSKETVFSVSWEDTIAPGLGGDEPLSEPALPFILNRSFGYVDTEGRFSGLMPVHYGVDLAKDRYVSYANIQDSLVVRERDGSVIGLIENGGYPFYADDRLFLVATDRMGISELNADGEVIWHRAFGSVISSFDTARGAVGIGLLNGWFHLIDQTGADILGYETTGSRVLAVYGCAVSADLSVIGIISGLDPQRLVILESRNGEYRPVNGFNLNHQYRKKVFMDFSPAGDVLYYESPAGIEFLEMKRSLQKTIPFSGRIAGMTCAGSGTISCLVARGNGTSALRFFSPSGAIMYERELTGTDPFVGYLPGLYVIGVGEMIAAFSVELR